MGFLVPRFTQGLGRCSLLGGILPILGASCTVKPGSDSSPQLLTEVTRESGIPSPDAQWPDGKYRIAEITASGVAVFDFDGDSNPDIYLICHPPPSTPDSPAPNRLFRQVAPLQFAEVPGAAGLGDPGYGNGVAIGDLDNDGDVDVYVCNVGPDALYLNQGGAFVDATQQFGLRDSEWTTAASFFDYDRDGDLDLYVVHYLVDDPTRVCRVSLDARQDYCGPVRYQSVVDTLYRNDGGVKLTDVSQTAGIVQARPGLGVACLDLTGDRWPDIYVACDKRPNLLYVNRRDGTFSEEALVRGVALSGSGEPEASMGVGVGDVNGDLLLDILVTNLFDETSTLYLASPRGVFEDRSAAFGLGGPTLRSTSWGCGFVDLDNDGDLDLPIVNGKIERSVTDPRARLTPFWNEYALSNQLFLGDGSGKFVEATGQAGTFGSEPDVSRALALGDLDGDGDVDLVSSTISNRLRIFRNDSPRRGSHWLRVRAVTGTRDALGALVRLSAGGARQVRPVLSSYSYAASSEPIAHFGLGTSTRVDSIEVDWPSGRSERFGVNDVDRVVTLREGSGEQESGR